LKKAREHCDIAITMEPQEFKTLRDGAHESLTSKTESLMERSKDEMVSALMEHVNDTKPLNATEKRIGVDIPPVLLGLIPITKLNKTDHEKDQLLAELRARRLQCDNLTWKSRWPILEKDELVRWKQRNPDKKENEFHKGFFSVVSDEVGFDYVNERL
jgi:hypothetical protein